MMPSFLVRGGGSHVLSSACKRRRPAAASSAPSSHSSTYATTPHHLLAYCLPPPLLLLLLPVLVTARAASTSSSSRSSSMACFLSSPPPSLPSFPLLLSSSQASSPSWHKLLPQQPRRTLHVSLVARKDARDGPGAALQRAPRLYAPDALLRAGGHVALSSDQLHYLIKVMRLRIGASVRVFNAKEGEWACVLEEGGEGGGGGGGRAPGASGKKRDRSGSSNIVLVAQEQLRQADVNPMSLRLCFAPIKRTRLRTLLEKATELGVTHLQPVLTDYTDLKGDNEAHAEGIWAKTEGWLIEAAEQCERLDIPRVLPPMTLAALLEEAEGEGGPLFICRERAGGQPLWHVLQEGEGEKRHSLPSFLIGPEGGFSPNELVAMEEQPRRLVSLGPTVLRAETAAIVALGVYVAWREGGQRCEQ